MQFNSGDILVLYTDGITEAKNMKKHEYGFERLGKLLQDNHSSSPTVIKDIIIKDLYKFCGQESLDDDYTMLIVKFK
jgi:serine phosphatase RsbU (regulator of sigma subunit)